VRTRERPRGAPQAPGRDERRGRPEPPDLSKHERHRRALRDRAQLLHEIVRDRHAVLEPLASRRHLRVARDQHGLRGIGVLGVVEDIDHLIEIVLELPLAAKRARIDRQEEVADVVRIGRFFCVRFRIGENEAPHSVPPRMCTMTARP